MQEDLNISVIIPAYNEEAFIGRAIDSVMKQSLLPKEIIVVDDGSTDRTGEVVKNYNNVNYIRKENAGLAAARNTGIQASKSEFIAFLDSDDEWDMDYLKNSWEMLSSHPDINWCCSAYDRRLVNGEIAFTKKVDEKWIKDGVIENYFACEAQEHFSITITMIVKRIVFIEVGMFDSGISQFGEDLDMWFRIALENPSIIYSSRVGAQYWERKGSITDNIKVDIPRFLHRIQRSESAALIKGLEARQMSEPVIVDWLNRAVKESVRQSDKDNMSYIHKYYGNRLSFKYFCLLIVSMKIPTFIIKNFINMRNTLIH